MSETPLRAFDPIRPIKVSDPITQDVIERAQRGELLADPDLAAVFGFKHAQFYKQKKAGQFDQFLAKPPIGRQRYSGVLLYRYLCGNPVYEPTFGRKRRPT
jgi:hypothetical protein